MRTDRIAACALLVFAISYHLAIRSWLKAAGCDFWEYTFHHSASGRNDLFEDYCKKYASGSTMDLSNRTIDYLELEGHLRIQQRQGVPLILHQMHKSRAAVPSYLGEYLDSCHNMSPGWVHVFWGDDDLEPFLARHHPDFLPFWKKLPTFIQKIDAIRYPILQTYGGVYLDTDVHCMKPLDDWLLLFGQNYSVFMEPIHMVASSPHHPYWKAVMDRLLASKEVWKSAAQGLMEHAAETYNRGHKRGVLIDRNKKREDRLFRRAGYLEMLGVSTWQWRTHKEKGIVMADRLAAVAVIMAIIILVAPAFQSGATGYLPVNSLRAWPATLEQ